MYTREQTRRIRLGHFFLGQGEPIRVQSMLKVPLERIEQAILQAHQLEAAGCEIIRVAIPEAGSLDYLDRFIEAVKVPIVADIHFDYRLAVASVEKGVAGLRINPGNIGPHERVRCVVAAAQAHSVPIRIGVNAGSLDRKLIRKHGGVNGAAMVASALEHIRILERLKFEQIKISLKASSVPLTIEAYTGLAREVDYPLHLGITEAGPPGTGSIKSAVGLGILLQAGLGDTIRVSLTGSPSEEVKVGFEILKALGLRQKGPTLVSCPTCGRCKYDILPLVRQVEQEIEGIDQPLTVAVMGCEVNGPGEAREADIGIAGGKKSGLIFIKGQTIGKYPEASLLEAFRKALKQLLNK
ncbi:flavodoxin-dependent (E)-4-hydroxy-3-methylbut-2-enyl-diphosphate synthase [bacterium]|nr:flavodoxin-dependent (E)-4-hydroxy-3-methylbut-2-enyl-diphosphate synthase [bacterium]